MSVAEQDTDNEKVTDQLPVSKSGPVTIYLENFGALELLNLFVENPRKAASLSDV